MRTIKKIMLILLILIVSLPLFAATVGYDSALNEIVDTFAKVLGNNTPVAFVSMEADSEGFSQRFVSDVERNLVNKDIVVLDRSNVEAIVKELELQTSGLIDDDQAVSIGHMLGAKMIIAAKASNMVSSYHLDIQLIDIETTLVKRHLVYDIKYDTAFKNIINGSSANIGSQKFGIGLRGGMAFEFNKAHEDMVGEGLRPGEESPRSIVPTIAAFYRVLDNLKLQLEVSFVPSNGIDIKDLVTEDDDKVYKWNIGIKYSTIDIPLLVAWNFIQKPVSVDVFAGVYVSIPVSSVQMSFYEQYSGYKVEGAVDSTGIVYGVVGGFDAGFKVGPGTLLVDARMFYDLVPSKAIGELLDNEEQGLVYRRGVTASLGYMFEL